jgi:hypothetical protein
LVGVGDIFCIRWAILQLQENAHGMKIATPIAENKDIAPRHARIPLSSHKTILPPKIRERRYVNLRNISNMSP